MTFSPMTREELPQTVTLFNVYRDSETGEMSYYHTVLANVRVDVYRSTIAKGSQSESLRGTLQPQYLSVMVDKVTTKGRDADNKLKRFSPPRAWNKLPSVERENFWTLEPLSLLALPDFGQKKVLVPSFDENIESWPDFVARNNLSAVEVVVPTIDEDGSVHSWEVILG